MKHIKKINTIDNNQPNDSKSSKTNRLKLLNVDPKKGPGGGGSCPELGEWLKEND